MKKILTVLTLCTLVVTGLSLIHISRPYRTEVQLYKSLLALKRSIDRDCIVTSQREALQKMCIRDRGWDPYGPGGSPSCGRTGGRP